MNDDGDLQLIGLFMIRVAWLLAALGCVLVSLLAVLSGADRRDFSGGLPALFGDGGSSRQLPEFASSGPSDPLSARGTTETVAFHTGPAERARVPATGDGISTLGAADRSASQTEDVSGRAPSSRPAPNSPQSPSESQPSLPQGPSETSDTPSSSSAGSPSTSLPSTPHAPSIAPPSPAPPVSVGVSLSPPKAAVTVGKSTVALP
jgi:hypothetical protein